MDANVSLEETSCNLSENVAYRDENAFEIEPSAFGDPLIRTLYLMDQGTVLAKEDKHLKVIKHGRTIETIPNLRR